MFIVDLAWFIPSTVPRAHGWWKYINMYDKLHIDKKNYFNHLAILILLIIIILFIWFYKYYRLTDIYSLQRKLFLLIYLHSKAAKELIQLKVPTIKSTYSIQYKKIISWCTRSHEMAQSTLSSNMNVNCRYLRKARRI